MISTVTRVLRVVLRALFCTVMTYQDGVIYGTVSGIITAVPGMCLSVHGRIYKFALPLKYGPVTICCGVYSGVSR